jgi:hypothetical protein
MCAIVDGSLAVPQAFQLDCHERWPRGLLARRRQVDAAKSSNEAAADKDLPPDSEARLTRALNAEGPMWIAPAAEAIG